ncbi:MAG TPA: MBL fold metallo-hydrolase, partial [bacterium]|nr:MBL fold metallo-hydrolase [bacterium]
MSVEPSFPWLHWLHHASFRIESAAGVAYIDPYKLKSSTPADTIFVTHAHMDHFSPADIKKICKAGTLLVCPEKVAQKAKDIKVLVV